MNKITSDGAWVDELVSNCLDAPIPPTAETQLRAVIRNNNNYVTSRSSTRITRRRVLLAITAAAAGGIAFGVPLFSNSAPQAWAQVSGEVRQKPWVHFSGVHSKGDPMEFWISFKDQTFAAKFGQSEFAHFQRGSDMTCCWYRRSEGVLTEDVYRPMPGEFGHLEHLFRDMSAGGPLSTLSGPDEVVSQSSSVVMIDGQRRWQYEFWIRAVDEGHKQMYSVIFLVDPITKLPTKWTRLKEDRTKQLTMQIDYPDSGPNSIFDLGVPQDIDRKQRKDPLVP
ncbi:MAG: hypothetical protein ACYC4U_20025 [Pirellulaceae bacterium]